MRLVGHVKGDTPEGSTRKTSSTKPLDHGSELSLPMHLHLAQQPLFLGHYILRRTGRYTD